MIVVSRWLMPGLPVRSKIQPVSPLDLSGDSVLHRLHLSTCVAIEAAAASAPTVGAWVLNRFYCFQSPYTHTDGQANRQTFIQHFVFRNILLLLTILPLRRRARYASGTHLERISSGARLCFIQLGIQSSELIRATFGWEVAAAAAASIATVSDSFLIPSPLLQENNFRPIIVVSIIGRAAATCCWRSYLRCCRCEHLIEPVGRPI